MLRFSPAIGGRRVEIINPVGYGVVDKLVYRSLVYFADAFARAKSNTKAPTLIECIIDREADILPMVPGGNALSDMITEYKKEGK